MSLPPKIRKLSDYEIEKKKDIIKLLLEKDMTHICFNILSRLDSKSFTNCRLVCHKWKDYIDYQFYETPKGKLWIINKLTSNYFDVNFTPTEEKINFQVRIIDFVADDSSICVLTHNDDFYFDIHSYNLHSFKKNWSFNNSNYIKEDTFQELYSVEGDLIDYEIALNKKRLYLYTSKKVAHIYIIDSNNGLLLHKLCNVFPNAEEETILDVIDYENSILVTCSVSGQLIFFDVNDFQSETQILYQENVGTDSLQKLDKNILFSVSNEDIISWNLDTRDREELKFHLGFFILQFEVKTPYLFLISCDEDHSLMVYNIVQKKLIKQIDFKSFIEHIFIVRNLFFILECENENEDDLSKNYENELSVFLYHEIVNETSSLTYNEMTSRKIKIISNRHDFKVHGICVLTSERSSKYIVKRSFWP